MHIRDIDAGRPVSIPPAEVSTGLRGSRAIGTSESTGSQPPREVDGRGPRADVSGLSSRLADVPDVRDAEIAAAKAAVANGELLTGGPRQRRRRQASSTRRRSTTRSRDRTARHGSAREDLLLQSLQHIAQRPFLRGDANRHVPVDLLAILRSAANTVE